MTDPRVAVYKPYEGRTVKIWVSLRPEVVLSGKMRVIETPESSPQPFAGFVLETEKGPQTITFGQMRKFEVVTERAEKLDRRKGKRGQAELP